jgi:hypothetical protein
MAEMKILLRCCNGHEVRVPVSEIPEDEYAGTLWFCSQCGQRLGAYAH